ncbi:MAG TPA: pyruvate ferredoxin oxidoreductase [Methanosarcinales archaeon]|nr:MAG: pyruvate ferredoxin oxidoreductase [Methanosarcinales archaeon]HDN65519.1 pyruvate ferredoxin oxidoreductase [Methanosarcinales archaeon]
MITESLLAPGHRGCAGCGASLAAKFVLEGAGSDCIMCGPTGCLEVFTTPYPESAWRVPYIHSLFENPAAVASGIETALAARGNTHTKVLVIAGDGSTFDIGIRSISGAFERGHNITYVCYDNEAYMNTGIQRSASTPFDASTTTSPAGTVSCGNTRPKKDMPAILVAHGSPYVATATIAYPKDVIRKIKTATETEGPAYVQIHASCCTGWYFDSSLAVEVVRLAVETALYPIFEIVNGELGKVHKIKQKPVEEYLRMQKRFAHLFKDESGRDEIAKIQAIADHNVERYGLARRT